MPDPRPILHRARFPLLALAILVQLVFVGYWLFIGVRDVAVLIYGSVIALIQTAFVVATISLHQWPVNMVGRGRPILKVVIAAGFLASVLLIGLVFTLLEWPGWWWQDPIQSGLDPIIFFGALLVGWVIWSVIFYFYWRRHDGYVGLTRITRGLLAGSALETLIAAPTMAIVKDPDNCVCARGSFFGLVVGITAILCLFGPGVVMIFLRQRYIAQRLLPLCAECSYNLTGSISPTCPECGCAIPPRLRDRLAG